MGILRTYSTSDATMDVQPIILRKTETTRLIFCPCWVSESKNQLRGFFRFQRKSPKDTWETYDHKPLSTLKKDEGYELRLTGEDMAILFGKLEGIKECLSKHGHHYGFGMFKLDEVNAGGVLVQIGDVKNRELIVEQLKVLESEYFENLGIVIGQARLERVIGEFESNLGNSDESFWQKFFEENTWVLQQVFAYPVIYLQGETYLGGKNTKGRQGSGGTATDFLYMNGSNGSFAVVEIKTPECGLIGGVYRGVKGSEEKNELYSIHGDLSGGIVQMEHQIQTAIESFKIIIGEDYDELTYLNPTGILVAGNYSNLSLAQKRSFDLFRKSMGKNLIFTYDEVLEKLKLLKSVYE